MGLNATERKQMEGSRLTPLIEDAMRVIRSALSQYSHPCVFWSGGKDSMVVLHLLRQILPPMPVVCWREPWLPAKQEFVNRMVLEWNLELWDYAPSIVALCEGNGRIDVVNHYMIGKGVMALARGTEQPDFDNEPWICGRDTFLARPTGTFAFPWDLGFHGHKSVDVDPTSGQVPLKVDISHVPGNCASCFPLRNWTDDDVFDYIRKFNVPYDANRYTITADSWELNKDKTLNPDYYSACFECCRKDRPSSVFCPKLKLEIENISSSTPYVEPSLEYCGLRTE